MKNKDNITQIKKIHTALVKMKKKYVTSEMLSQVLGLYPYVINETLSIFNPVITLDFDFNLMDILPYMEKYIEESENKKESQEKKFRVTKKIIGGYESIGDFFYKKMTIGGIVDRDAVLSTDDLKVLKKLVNDELSGRENPSKNKKRKK